MVVTDASIWVSRLVPQDAFHIASRDWLTAYTMEGGEIVVPALLEAEVTGAIARRIGDAQFALRAIETILRLPALRIVPVDKRLAHEASALAANLRLRGADAIYVAVALHLGIPLFTWDAEQRQRASAIVAVHTPNNAL